jgi:hypothetical protein
MVNDGERFSLLTSMCESKMGAQFKRLDSDNMKIIHHSPVFAATFSTP